MGKLMRQKASSTRVVRLVLSLSEDDVAANGEGAPEVNLESAEIQMVRRPAAVMEPARRGGETKRPPQCVGAIEVTRHHNQVIDPLDSML